MKREGTYRGSALARAAFYAILFIFFLQLLSDFIESVYAFGLLGGGLPPEMVAVLLLFSPLLLLLTRDSLPDWALLLLMVIVMACRIAEVPLATLPKMLISGAGVACFLLFFPALLWRLGRDGRASEGGSLGAGLALALVTSIAFSALYSGVDLSTSVPFQFVGWILAGIGVILSVQWYRQLGGLNRQAAPAEHGTPARQVSLGKVTALSLGITSVFVLLYFAFASPHVIARWTAGNYLLLLAALLASICLAIAGLSKDLLRRRLTPALVWVWNIVFISALVLTILSHQAQFPPNPAGYPLFEPAAPALSPLFLALALVCSPVILVDFALYSREMIALRPSLRSLAGAFGIASFYLLVMLLAHVFTSVYAYIPLVGTFFRDKFWLVYLAAGIALALPLLLVSREAGVAALPGERKIRRWLLGYAVLVSLLAIAGAYYLSAKPVSPSGGRNKLRIVTYNIQQGYSAAGLRDYQGQFELLRELDADLIGLQETGTNRISGGNRDIVRFFADNLDMHAYYGPKTVTGTFGIALLSKYPLEDPQTFYMYSEGEQTATIRAGLNLGGETFDVFVTHLGNGGPIIQQEQVMSQVDAERNVILMGDFNFEPRTPQYRMTVERLADAWLLKWPGGIDDKGVEPGDRIDHIFLSPGIQVTEARFIFSPASDHPAEMVTIVW